MRITFDGDAWERYIDLVASQVVLLNERIEQTFLGQQRDGFAFETGLYLRLVGDTVLITLGQP